MLMTSSILIHIVLILQYGEENSNTSFVLEISWGETYPETPPTVNMDTFYNKHM